MKAVLPEGPPALPLVARREVHPDDDARLGHAHAHDLAGKLREGEEAVLKTISPGKPTKTALTFGDRYSAK